MNAFGVADGPRVFASSSATPFGFSFGKRNQLVVSEAVQSAASSYAVSDNGNVELITGTQRDKQAAACWLIVRNDGRYAYAANAGTATVSGYSIDADGTLALLDGNGVTGTTTAGPVDIAMSSNARYLYTLNARSGMISVFAVSSDGSLDKIQDAPVAMNTNGFAAR